MQIKYNLPLFANRKLLIIAVLVFLLLPSIMPAIAYATSYEYDLVTSDYRMHPLLLLNSPYYGSAQATDEQSIDWVFGSLVTYQSDYSSSMGVTASNGASNGLFRVQKVGIYKVYQINFCFLSYCYKTYIGEVAKPIYGTALADVSINIAPEGTVSDWNLPTQVSWDGYKSITFDIRYKNKDFEYVVTAGSSPLPITVYKGNHFVANINLGVSIEGVSVSGLLKFDYETGTNSEYKYVFNSDPYSDRIWYVDYLGDYDVDHHVYPLIWAFDYIGSSGGGGCPFVATEHNNKEILINNLLPEMELFNRTNLATTDSLLISKDIPVIKNRTVMFSIVEPENSIDYIYIVKLYSIHLTDPSYNLAIGSDGVIYAYKDIYLPNDVWNNNGEKITELVTNNSMYYTGYDGEYIVVTPSNNGTHLILSLKDDPNIAVKSPVTVYFKLDNAWKKIAVIMPRANWSTFIVPLPSLDGEERLVKLAFTGKTEVRLVGTTNPVTDLVKVRELPLMYSSLNGNNVLKIMKNPSEHIVLNPGDDLLLGFREPKVLDSVNAFLIKVKGFYVYSAFYDNNKSSSLAWIRYHNMAYVFPVLHQYDNIVSIEWYLDGYKLNVNTEILHLNVDLRSSNEHKITAIVLLRDGRSIIINTNIMGIDIRWVH
ncbi:MAG: hypothetical protein GSR79_00810 [Desulfurococcales archaeon]|nr:hypothetical protein [Desulfurococcales archaeon]